MKVTVNIAVSTDPDCWGPLDNVSEGLEAEVYLWYAQTWANKLMDAVRMAQPDAQVTYTIYSLAANATHQVNVEGDDPIPLAAGEVTRYLKAVIRGHESGSPWINWPIPVAYLTDCGKRWRIEEMLRVMRSARQGSMEYDVREALGTVNDFDVEITDLIDWIQ